MDCHPARPTPSLINGQAAGGQSLGTGPRFKGTGFEGERHSVLRFHQRIGRFLTTFERGGVSGEEAGRRDPETVSWRQEMARDFPLNPAPSYDPVTGRRRSAFGVAEKPTTVIVETGGRIRGLKRSSPRRQERTGAINARGTLGRRARPGLKAPHPPMGPPADAERWTRTMGYFLFYLFYILWRPMGRDWRGHAAMKIGPRREADGRP